MKKFLVILPLFLFLVALDAYLISDFISTQNKPAPAVKGISTQADSNVIELEIKNEEEDSEGERIRTSPTPIPVEIIDKRGASAASEEDDTVPTVTNTPQPTNTPSPTPTLSPTPSPIRITIPPVIT